MADKTPTYYIEATQEAGRAFVTRRISRSAALEDSRLLPLTVEHV
jgi:hypothetical protein